MLRIPDFLFRAIVVFGVLITAVGFASWPGEPYKILQDQGSALGAVATFLAAVVALYIALWQWQESERSREREDAERSLVAFRIVGGALSVVGDDIERTETYAESIEAESRIRGEFASLPLQALIDHLGRLDADIVEGYFRLHNEIEKFKKDRSMRSNIDADLHEIEILLNRLEGLTAYESAKLRAKAGGRIRILSGGNT